VIRLSLPAYDTTRPLTFSIAGHIGVSYELSETIDIFEDVWVRTWADGFVGDVNARGQVHGVAHGPGMVPVSGHVFISNPDALGMTGSEGWFTLEFYASVFVHDVLVDYTPLAATGGRAQGHFS